MKPRFNVEFLEEASVFLDKVDAKARQKIIYNIRKAQVSNDSTLFKKLDDHIWEFRTLYNGIHYRMLAFWDEFDKSPTVVIATHGFIKKSQKTPLREIHRAEYLRKLYFELK